MVPAALPSTLAGLGAFTSVQVHEKSVLLPLLPVSLLAGCLPSICLWMMPTALASMYPLLARDGLALPYAALLLLWCGGVWPWGQQVSAGGVRDEIKESTKLIQRARLL